ncbi:hypothetical protein T4B_668 [Trichinella pseudospiralis]|uniref:Secreted protein n=1 Tax=Trichinella pseudospiralis TaxID=6337 RepID=A0A0V1K8A4_TRIPS|nr:hypothetical protein T4B_668 [Trichinella pseudospiralis]KRZ43444.1 hypothetical protein T4C_10511 [Trichinella pseudospiralis]
MSIRLHLLVLTSVILPRGHGSSQWPILSFHVVLLYEYDITLTGSGLFAIYFIRYIYKGCDVFVSPYPLYRTSISISLLRFRGCRNDSDHMETPPLIQHGRATRTLGLPTNLACATTMVSLPSATAEDIGSILSAKAVLSCRKFN